MINTIITLNNKRNSFVLLIIAFFINVIPVSGQNNLELITKPNLRVLDLGNSYTQGAVSYLPYLIGKMEVDVSDMCLYCVTLSNSKFSTWYNALSDDTLFVNQRYRIFKAAGGLEADAEIGLHENADASAILHLLTANEWDLIIIHQQSAAAPYYDTWNGEGSNGKLNELIARIRELQPQCAIGTYLVHSYSDNYINNTEESSYLRWQLIAQSVKRFVADYDLDFVLPYGTAIQNLRRSSINDDMDLTKEGVHLSSGLAYYTACCCYYETLIAPRTGKSMMGNSYRIEKDVDILVTDENAPIAQEAVRLAMNDWYSCVNPEDPSDVGEPCIVFSDKEVKRLCLSNWDENEDGLLSEREASSVETIGNVFQDNAAIKSFDELYYFTGLREISSSAFENSKNLQSVVLPENVHYIGDKAFKDCYHLKNVTLPEKLLEIGSQSFYSCVNLQNMEFPPHIEIISDNAFYYCKSLNEVVLPASVTSIGPRALNCQNLIRVYCEREQPIDIFDNTFSDATYSNGKLTVPYGSGHLYQEASGWKLFSDISEDQATYESITIPANEGENYGVCTFCSPFDLDFNNVTSKELKAYIVTGYRANSKSVIATRVKKAPSGTGLIIRGRAGTYTLPSQAITNDYINLLIGVTEKTWLPQTDGDKVNLILAKRNEQIGFYSLSEDGYIDSKKAYLQLPFYLFDDSSTIELSIDFVDDEKSGIIDLNNTPSDSFFYTVSGLQVAHPHKGIYIHRGKKIVVR